MSNNTIRARLAETLSDHSVWCCGGYMPASEWSEHLADVLLALPDITIEAK